MINNPKEVQKKLVSAIVKDGVGIVVPPEIESNSVENTVEKLESERRRILDAIAIKNLDAVGYNQLVESLARITHDLQLLSGKPTEITREEQLAAEENDINIRIRNLEARIGFAESQSKKSGNPQDAVSERKSSEEIRPERQN